MAIANQMGQRSESCEEFLSRFSDRLQAFAASHEALVERNSSSVPMQEIVRVLAFNVGDWILLMSGCLVSGFLAFLI